MSKSFTLDRQLGFRFFTKGDGNVYLTVPSGQMDENGKVIWVDKLVSQSHIDAQAALTATEYKKVDSVVTDARNTPERVVSWMLGLGNGIVERVDGMKHMMYWYNRRTNATSSRMTMNLEDDAPGSVVSVEEDGVPMPLEFADWTSSVRQDPVASMSAGYDVSAEKARNAAESVTIGNDLRQINGWDGLEYRGKKVYGFRDVPATLTLAQAGTIAGGGWLATAVTTTQIYTDIKNMVRLADLAGIPGPFVLILPKSFRHRLAETYSTTVNGEEKSLWMKILEKPSAEIPNVLGISQIKLIEQMDNTSTGGTPAAGEAYLLSLSPKYFRVLNYLPAQSFTIDLKGTLATKHRVVEGVCPLFKKDASNYGIVKLVAPAS